jgi:hypothetical protein
VIRHPELAIGFGVFGVVFGAALLVLLARRARRAKRLRVAQRRPEFRQAPSGWRGQWLDAAGAAMVPPPATRVPPPPPSGAGTSRRGGALYGTPTRDPAETSVMPRCPWGDR